MDFSMKFKSFPLLGEDEIHSFGLKIETSKMLLKKSRFSFLGVLITPKNGLHWTLDSGIEFPKISLWEWLNGFLNEMQVLSLLAYDEIQSFMLKIQKIKILLFRGANHI